ncbi:MAG TPA: PAS domain-containing protein [Nitrospirae bacterium]|nr:PAS domain-containing protein [Nitrospirota bacterium]
MKDNTTNLHPPDITAQKTRSIYILTLIRIIFSTLIAGLQIFFNIGITSSKFQVLIYLWILTVFIVSILYLALARVRLIKKRFLGGLLYLQFFVDIILIDSLIILTGGIESWFSFLNILLVIAAAMVLGRRGGIIIATATAILYGIIIDLQFYGLIPVSYNASYRVTDFLYNIFVNITGLLLTAYLMGYLVSRLEKTSETLQKKDVDLRELSRFHSEVIENIPSGLFTTDADGRIYLFNSAAEKITGLSREEVALKGINTVFPFLPLPLLTGRHEGRINTPENEKYIGMNISTYRNSEGRVVGYIGTFQDVTAIIRMEEEIKRKEKLAAIGQLSSSIAHELRNPLASIKSSFEMLREGHLPSETRQRLMEIAINEMDRLNKIVTDFLTYSNPKPPEHGRFNISRLVDELFEMQMTINEGIQFQKEIEEDIKIVADQQKIRQLMWNLLLNAIDAVSGKEGRIYVSLKKTNAGVEIRVRDNGRGIKKEDMDKIFYPFYSTKEKGTGLGLAIAYRIVEEHGGRIDVNSEEGSGAEFVITIPPAPEEAV